MLLLLSAAPRRRYLRDFTVAAAGGCGGGGRGRGTCCAAVRAADDDGAQRPQEEQQRGPQVPEEPRDGLRTDPRPQREGDARAPLGAAEVLRRRGERGAGVDEGWEDVPKGPVGTHVEGYPEPAAEDDGAVGDPEDALEPDALLPDEPGDVRLGAAPDVAHRADVRLREAALVVQHPDRAPVEGKGERRAGARRVCCAEETREQGGSRQQRDS